MIEEEIPEARGSVYGDNSGSMLTAARDEQSAALYDVERDGGRTFAMRKAEFLASAAKQRVTSRQTAADAADTIKLAKEVWALIDVDRRARSDPYRAVHLALSAQASEFWDEVNEAMAGLNRQIDAYTDAEDERIAAQQREQEEAFARMRQSAAPAPAVEPPAAPTGRQHIDYAAPAATPVRAAPAMKAARRAPIRGDLGSQIIQRGTDIYEIDDISLIPDHIMQSKTVIEAILTVVRSTARHMGVPPGIRVRTETGNQIR